MRTFQILGRSLQTLERGLHVRHEVRGAIPDAHEVSVGKAVVPGHVAEHLERFRDRSAVDNRFESIGPLRHVPTAVASDKGELLTGVSHKDSRRCGPANDPTSVSALESGTDSWSDCPIDPLATLNLRAPLAHTPHVRHSVVELRR